jgi:hypothetical protein
MDEPPRVAPQITPNAVTAYGIHDQSFTLQAIMDLRGSMAELKVGVESLKSSVDTTRSKVDDLVNWKNRILGGALVIGALMGIGGFLVAKFSAYVTIKNPNGQSASTATAPTSVRD